jgi:tRNA-specific 2-thiouridylase
MYVIKINSRQNVITLGDDKDLYKDKLYVKGLSLISGNKLLETIKAEVKIRYNGKKSPAIISPYSEDKVLINFKGPERAVTPGQSAVFYQGDVVIGGGVIEG